MTIPLLVRCAFVGSSLITKRSGDRGHSEGHTCIACASFLALTFHPLPEPLTQLMNGKLPS